MAGKAWLVSLGAAKAARVQNEVCVSVLLLPCAEGLH